MTQLKIDCTKFGEQSDVVKELVFNRIKRPHLLPFQKKEFSPTAPLVIEGYGNFAKPDRGGEIMPKECWDLANYLLNPVICLNHDWECLVGGAENVEAKDEGLFVRAVIGNPTEFGLTEDQVKARCLIAQGYLKTFSVGFIPWAITYDEKNDLIIYDKAELLEVSLVTIPMQQESLFNVVKSMLLKNDPIIIGGNMSDTKGTTEGDGTGGQGEGAGTDEGDKPLMEVVNKMFAELQGNTKICQEMHGKVCGGDKSKELEQAEESIKELTAKVEQLTAELATATAEKTELEKSAEQLLALIESK